MVCLVAYSATPSYSNFSSNQFAPSGTYTVTVKAKAEMTNTVFRGVGTPAAELHGGWLSTNDTTGSITVMSNASTVWSNGVAAGSVAITNAGGIMNLEGGPFGTVLQFRFNTSGSPVMVISNGCVGIGKATDSGIRCDISGNVQCNSLFGPSALTLGTGGSGRWVLDSVGLYTQGKNSLGKNVAGGTVSQVFLSNAVFVANGGTDFTVHETATNTVIYSQGTNLVISDGIQANSTYGQFNQFTFSTSGTPVMVISNGMVGIGKANPANALDVYSSGKISACFLGTFFTCDGTIACGNILGKGFLFCGGSESSNRPGIFSMAFNTNIILISDSRRSINDQPISGAALAFDSIYQDPSPYESATNTLVYSRSNALYVSDPTAAPGSIIQQNASAFMTPATITNLLNVTAGKTNGIFVITNGPLVYIWSDGFNIYSKTIAP